MYTPLIQAQTRRYVRIPLPQPFQDSAYVAYKVVRAGLGGEVVDIPHNRTRDTRQLYIRK